MRGRFDREYTDAGECLRCRISGWHVITKKQYGNDAWEVTVWKRQPRAEGGMKVECVYHAPAHLRRTRPRRSELAALIDSLRATEEAP